MTSEPNTEASSNEAAEPQLPLASDSSHWPSEKMKRGSRNTAIAIVIFIIFWILLGLRHALFGI